jgi:cytoskeletal protein CcmA (bactofilin family)
MRLFGKDRGERDRMEDVRLAPQTPADAIAPKEVTMGERDTTPGRHGDMDAFLGKGTKVEGKLMLEGTGRIEGQVDGEISAKDTLTIGDSAVVNATISGTSIIIEGRVTGDVFAAQRLDLRAASRVEGNISTPCLVVQDGAVLEGRCSMSGAEGPAHADRRPAPTMLTPERRPDSPVHVVAASR